MRAKTAVTGLLRGERQVVAAADPVQGVALGGRAARPRGPPPTRSSGSSLTPCWVPAMRLMLSSISVPPRSFTPQRSASVAASRPIFTQLACRLGIVRPSASRNTAVCLRFSSREISSIPCVRPSSVWNGMNESGTNSVKPPVRSCSSRTTRMCSASSHGSSMWPNITVTVERRPAACAASMISTQRATGSLFGEIRSRTPSCSTSAAVPGRGVQARGLAGGRTPRRSGQARPAHVVHLHRRVGVQVHVRRHLLGHAQPASRSPRAPQSGWMPDCMQISVAPNSTASATRRSNSSRSCSYASGERRALAEAAERAAHHADVRHVDVAVDHERHRLARQLAAQLVGRLAHVLDRLRAASRRTARSALSGESGALAGALRWRPARAPARRGRSSRRPEPRRGMKLQYFSLITSSTPCSSQLGVHVLGVDAQPLGERVAGRRQSLAHPVRRRERVLGRDVVAVGRQPAQVGGALLDQREPPVRRGSAGSARPRRASAAGTRAPARACPRA